MMINLYEHNQVAYNNLIEVYKRSNRAAIIHPTGSGKSYIALKLMEDNPDTRVLYLSPSLQILHQIKKNLISSGMKMKHPNCLKRMTYQKLIKMSTEELSKLNPDLIVLDEFHHLGGQEWGAAVEALLELYPNTKVLGLSATPMRYNDGEGARDMSVELFDGNIASEINLEQAIQTGIFSKPEYTIGLYSYSDIVKEFERKVEDIKEADNKQLAIKNLDLLKRELQEAITSLPQLLEDTMKNKCGKYIVYCRDIDDMKKKMGKAIEMFERVNPNIEIMSMSSDESIRENERILNAFEQNNNPNKLKLLFSVNMLNEGYHLKDIDGVIMMRPTHSPTLYTQQLGRAMSVGNGKTPIVIDLVNNIDSIQISETFFDSIGGPRRPKGEKEVPEFGIYSGYRKIKELIDKIDGLTGRQNYTIEEKLEIIKRFAETGERIVRGTIFEGHPIHAWRTDVRNAYKNKLIEFSEEEKNELIKNGILYDNCLSREEKAQRILKWISDHEDNRIPKRINKQGKNLTAEEKEENLLGTWVLSYTLKKTPEEREKFIKVNPIAAEIFQKIDLIENKNRKELEERARMIIDWITAHEYKRLPVRNTKESEDDKYENQLGTWILAYTSRKEKEEREKYIEEYPFAAEVFAKIDLVDMHKENPFLIQMENIQIIEKWFEKNERKKFPPTLRTKDSDEIDAAQRYIRVKSRIAKFIYAKNEEELNRLIEKDPEGATLFYRIDAMKREVEVLIQSMDSDRKKEKSGKTMEMIVEKRKENNIRKAQMYKEWIINHPEKIRPSRHSLEDKEEKKIAIIYETLLARYVRPYLNLKTDEEKKKFVESYPELPGILAIVGETEEIIKHNQAVKRIENAQKIETWIREHEDSLTLPSMANDGENGFKLNKDYWYYKGKVVKPYSVLETEEERKKFEEDYPGAGQITAIIKSVDEELENRRKKHEEGKAQMEPPKEDGNAEIVVTRLDRMRQVRDWIDTHGFSRLPSSKSKDEEEQLLGNFYTYTKSAIIVPYLRLDDEEEKRMYREKRPDIEELVGILYEIETKLSKPVEPNHLASVRRVKQWFDNNGEKRLPSIYRPSSDEEERKLSDCYKKAKERMLAKYIKFETEEEKRKFEKKHPELPEIVFTMQSMESETERGISDLTRLVLEYWEKRNFLEEARRLEAQYKEVLKKKERERLLRTGEINED